MVAGGRVEGYLRLIVVYLCRVKVGKVMYLFSTSSSSLLCSPSSILENKNKINIKEIRGKAGGQRRKWEEQIPRKLE